MIMRVLFAAILAGFAAGLAMTTIQNWKTTPLILKAEAFEKANAEAAGEPKKAETAQATNPPAKPEPWAPSEGFERIAYSVVADIIVAIGFALMLVAASLLTKIDITPQNGAYWGLLAFAVFNLIPASGLQPDLPAMPAADLLSRQIWWWSAVVAGIIGVGLIALRGGVLFSVIGVAIILVPHIIGAPQPESHETTIPVYLIQPYVANSMLMMAVTWVVAGITLGFTLRWQKLVEA